MNAVSLRPLAALPVAGILCAVATGQSTCIDFDGLPCDAVVTNQFPGATFSSVAGRENRTSCLFDLGTTLPNYICTSYLTGELTCSDPTFVDFTTPVKHLTFVAAGDDSAGVTAKVDVYQNAVFTATVDVVTDGVFRTPHLVDLTAFSDVTRIEIHEITDLGGLAWDDFCFDDCGITSQCEPPASPHNVGINHVSGCRCASGSILFHATDLPSPDGSFAYLLIGQSNLVFTDPPGALGDLCIAGGGVGRYSQGADLQPVAGGATGTVDVLNAVSGGGGGAIPAIGGNLCAPVGQTLHFQWWARNGMNPATFTNALTITFR